MDLSGIRGQLTEREIDTILVKAQMRYGESVRQEIVETVDLQENLDTYTFDFVNFGKHYVTVSCQKENETVSVWNEFVVGIGAQEYNIAYLNATFPVVLFTLSLWENQNSITKGAKGNPIPTFCVFERANSWNWEKLPEHVYRLPYAEEECYQELNSKAWVENRDAMAAYVKDLYEISPNARFYLYTVDNYSEHIPMMMDANRIPQSQYDAVLLSDGAGTYVVFNRVYQDDLDGSKYRSMCEKWETCRRSSFEQGVYVPIEGEAQGLPEYAAVAAAQDNVAWWVARTNGTFQIPNEDLLAQTVGLCTVKGVADMLADLIDLDQEKSLKELYRFDQDMFTDSREAGKPVMLFLGTHVPSEQHFTDYASLMMDYYGDSFQYYYKGHPGTPTALYPDKQKQLQTLGMADIDSSIPAELILFFFPDIYLCGYDSSTYLSVEKKQMACGLFGKNKADGRKLDYGKLMDFFATPVNEQDLVYGELYKEKESCYLVEFQDFSEKDCAIYDADTRDFTYYKKTDGGFRVVKQPSTAVLETGNTFKIDGDTYKVTKSGSVPQAMFLKTSAARAKVKIPAVVKKDGISYKVTAIADQALRLDKTIKTLIIGNHVTVIGARAFANCWQLKKVTIGTGLKRIGKEAFRGCQKLKAVTIRSEKLKKVGTGAFRGSKPGIRIAVPGKCIRSYQKFFQNDLVTF